MRILLCAVIALILCILALSGLFEVLNLSLFRWLHHRAKQTGGAAFHGLSEIVHEIFKEITILGFISLSLFTMAQSGLIRMINDRIFGQNATEKAAIREAAEHHEEALAPPTKFLELFEEIHILIFVIMVMYICLAAFFLVVGAAAIRHFERLDEASKNLLRGPESRGGAEPELQEEEILSSIPAAADELQFFGLRRRFIHPPIPLFPHPPDDSFKFAEYLGRCYNHLLVELIELPAASLLFVVVVGALVVLPLFRLAAAPFVLGLALMAALLIGLSAFAYASVSAAFRKLLAPVADVQQLAGAQHGIIQRQGTRFWAAPAGAGGAPAPRPGSPAAAAAAGGLAPPLLSAPIDAEPLFARGSNGEPKDRIERQLPFGSIPRFIWFMQNVLLLSAVFPAVLLYKLPKWAATWATRGQVIAVGCIAGGVVVATAVLWTFIIKDFNFVASLDCRVHRHILHEVLYEANVAEDRRFGEILRALVRRAPVGEIPGPAAFREAEIRRERAAVAFQALEPEAQRAAIEEVYVAVRDEHTGAVHVEGLSLALQCFGWTREQALEELGVGGHRSHGHRDPGSAGAGGPAGGGSGVGCKTREDFLAFVLRRCATPNALQDDPELRAERRARFERVFQTADLDQSGALSVDEILALLTTHVPPVRREEVQRLILKLDPEGAARDESLRFDAFFEFLEKNKLAAAVASDEH